MATPKAAVVSCRVTETDADLLRLAADVEDVTVSALVARIVREHRPQLAQVAYGTPTRTTTSAA